MKDYRREHPQFSLCGLNCLICPMHLGGYCPGCGGGEGHQACAFIRCSLEQGKPEFCFQCSQFPCGRYEAAMEFDSFIPHSAMVRDQERARELGADTYLARLAEKRAILDELLADWNDGRKKSFYCTAVSLLDLADLYPAMEKLRSCVPAETPIKEKAAAAFKELQAAARGSNITLKLNKKPKK